MAGRRDDDDLEDAARAAARAAGPVPIPVALKVVELLARSPAAPTVRAMPKHPHQHRRQP
jgi:hypothetical protein